jgi:hypothetical protein
MPLTFSLVTINWNRLPFYTTWGIATHTPHVLATRKSVFPGSNLAPKHTSSANDSKQDDHNGNHQKNVNETTHGVGSDEPQEPQ